MDGLDPRESLPSVCYDKESQTQLGSFKFCNFGTWH